ncbi:hypothetical protein [uncultured Streptomyces sp.]|uniref:hypothetical protein n=1 Tax=uncultured Streptomyces sp. TaxID=174707 RepID=UPI002603AB2F|nr:hypothetical protein [uncultured Streptomyces sp.]
MRPSRDPAGGKSPTPIYDALYSEYLRSFRALPGDRSGEESLGFLSFGTGMYAGRAPAGVRPGAAHPGGGQSTAASGHGATGGQSARGAQSGHSGGSWQRVGRHAGRPQPAALPPGAPRDS